MDKYLSATKETPECKESTKDIENTGQSAIFNYIQQADTGNPKPEALTALMEILNQKRNESENLIIFRNYTPSALPDYPSSFKKLVTTNRIDELTQAMGNLMDNQILLISGADGTGKTTLARILVDTRPANVVSPFWFDFSKNMDATLEDVLERLAIYMRAPQISNFKNQKREAGSDDIDRLIDELDNRQPLWLVFDSLDLILKGGHFHDAGMELLFTALCNNPGQAKIIMISDVLPVLEDGRNLLDAVDATSRTQQELSGLKDVHAIDYLMKKGLGGVERGILEEMTNAVKGHPVSLNLILALIEEYYGIDKLLGELRFHNESGNNNDNDNIVIIARKLFENLDKDEKEILERISIFRQPEPMIAIKKMFTDMTSSDSVAKAIDHSLLEADGIDFDSYRVHPLIRKFAYECMENKERTQAHLDAMQYYLFQPRSEKRTSKDDVRSLLEAHHHACMAKDYDKAVSVIFYYKLHQYLDKAGYHRTLVGLYEGILPEDHLNGEPLLSDLETHSTILGNLGIAYSDLGEVEKSIRYCEKALEIARQIGDKHGEGSDLGNLGLAYTRLGDHKKAIENYELALDISRQIDDRAGQGADLGNLGVAYSRIGEVEKAIEYYQEALKITQEIGDEYGTADHLGNLGNAYKDLGQVEKAIGYYEMALEISRDIGDKHNEVVSLKSLGETCGGLGDIDKAIECYEIALGIGKGMRDGKVVRFCEERIEMLKA